MKFNNERSNHDDIANLSQDPGNGRFASKMASNE